MATRMDARRKKLENQMEQADNGNLIRVRVVHERFFDPQFLIWVSLGARELLYRSSEKCQMPH